MLRAANPPIQIGQGASPAEAVLFILLQSSAQGPDTPSVAVTSMSVLFCHSAICRATSAEIPVLLQGYGITLGTINGLSVIISVFEAIPSLGLQVRI